MQSVFPAAFGYLCSLQLTFLDFKPRHSCDLIPQALQILIELTRVQMKKKKTATEKFIHDMQNSLAFRVS